MSLQSQLNAAAAGVTNAISDVFAGIKSLFKGPSDIQGNAGIVRAPNVTTTESASSALDSISDLAPLTDEEKQASSSLVADGRAEEAADIILPKSSLTKDEIIRVVQSLDASLAGTYVIEVGSNLIPDPVEIGSNNRAWSGGNTDREAFTYISTLEELQAEMAGIDREFTGVVVHWVESYDNANLTAGQIHDRANRLGGDGIGYHYIIQRNGSLQRGRAMDKPGEHCEKNDHNKKSIGLAFVGGYNAATGSTVFENNTGIKSLTRAQFNTFDHFCQTYYNQFPGGQIIGHNDVDEEEEDPGFDVIEYVFVKFGKLSKYIDTFSEQAITPEQINDN